MQRILISFLFVISPIILIAQVSKYRISFENAVHHEADINVTFLDIATDTLIVQMSRSSPGRYAIHEFAKNVYNFEAVDEAGNQLNIFRPDTSRWGITGHKGIVKISYTLFANRGDGTYSQIDETHAHLNMPATFLFAPQLSEGKFEVQFFPREDLNWKVATQLALVDGSTYSAPNLHYFMDSPTEISDFGLRTFELKSNGASYTIRLALHHNGTEEELNTYFESVKKVVVAQKEVFGEFPEFDYGSYTFLACYLPHASGDGMEHRNSTVLTSTRSLANGGLNRNIATVSHEFFHAWNVERIRPKSLEPFDFTAANMSGELWFAEGFTSYYADLILCRTGLRTPKQYVQGLRSTFNYVWNSPARQFFNPIEMSYQAPFVDAATSVDPVNRENTFISYYSYGHMLGLALDLALRQEGLHLDDYMKLVWKTFGKNEIPYTISDLHESLNKYAGVAFGNAFFDNFIFQSNMPEYVSLFKSVGVELIQQEATPYLGATLVGNGDGTATIKDNTSKGSPAYIAGLDKGDIINTINGMPFPEGGDFFEFIRQYKIGDSLDITYNRFGEEGETRLTLGMNPIYTIQLQEENGASLSAEILKKRDEWLKTK